MQREVVPLLCKNMKELLKYLPRDVVDGRRAQHSTMKVGFITYGKSVSYYQLDEEGPTLTRKIDREAKGLLVDPREAADTIDKLMKMISDLEGQVEVGPGDLGAAIWAGMEVLKRSGRVGKLMVFHSSLPRDKGPGGLRMREDRRTVVLGTEQEKTVLQPQGTFYTSLGQDLAKEGTSVDLYVFNEEYVDLATLGQVPKLTGGQCYKYTYFRSKKDSLRLLTDLKDNVSRYIVFDSVMRVRTSTEIQPVEYFGHLSKADVKARFASLDSSKSLAVELRHGIKRIERDGVYVQVALLYTSCGGQRRIRVLNLALSVARQLSDIFRHTDLETLVSYLGKESVVRLL